MKKYRYVLLWLIAGALCLESQAETNAIPWRLPSYTITARAMDLREALDTFCIAQGVPLIMSEHVSGSFSGNFADVPAAEFLDQVATLHNLTWYYDGVSLYMYGAGETVSTLIDLKYMKAGEVRALLEELGVEDSRFPIKTASNDELLMVSGPPRYVNLVSELIARADKLREIRTFNEVDIRIFPLVHTWADDVSFSASSPESSGSIKGMAHLLRDLMDETTRVDSTGTNTVEDAAQEKANQSFKPVILADNRLNAVVVRDVATRMPLYERLINQFDVPQKLIEIGITILEMSRDDSLDWQASLKASGAHNEMSATGGMNAQNLFAQSDTAGQGLAGALSYLGSKVNVEASLTALRTKSKARSISRTSVLTVNNMATEMEDTQSYYTKVIGTEVASLQQISAGSTLSIKPRILNRPPGVPDSEPQRIWMSMELDDGGFESLSVDSMPTTRSTSLTTQTAIPEDESILLAGYFRDIKESAGWGIPVLRDIPLIGWLFGGKSTRTTTVQRLFIFTPHIIDVDYYHATGQSVTAAQMLIQRDTTAEEDLVSLADDDDKARDVREKEKKEREQAEREALKEAERQAREAERAEKKAAKEAARRELESLREAEKQAAEAEKQAEKIKVDAKPVIPPVVEE